MNLSKRINSISLSPTLEISAKAKKMKREGIHVIGFGAGEPDFDTPEHVKSAAIEAIKDGYTKYTPAGGSVELKEAICNGIKRDYSLEYATDSVVVSCGAKHTLYNLFQCLCNEGDEVIIFSPYWVSYPEMIKVAGGTPVVVETDLDKGYLPDIEDVKKHISPKTKAMIINSPNNPAGCIYSREILCKLADIAIKNDILVVSDEVYEKLVFDGTHIPFVTLNKDLKDRTVIVNAVSKSYYMTGWRIGYALGPVSIIKAITKLQSHSTSNPCCISQKAAIAAISGPQDCVAEMKNAFNQRRIMAIERLKNIPEVKFNEPKGAFYIMVDLSYYLNKMGISISEFAKRLLNDKKVAVVPGAGFGFPNCFRLSYALAEEELEGGLERIKDFLA